MPFEDKPMPELGEHFILFNRLPLIYGRVPKVANSSVKAALTRLLENPPEEGYRSTADMLWRKGTHGETQMINAADALERRSSHFCFSFVRNPFDRLASGYNNKLIENNHISTAMQRMGLHLGMSFERFLEIVSDTTDEDLDVHLLPQTSILCIGRTPVPRFIGKMETMADHWQMLGRRMRQAGLPVLRKLPSKNVRRGGDRDLRGYFQNDKLITMAFARYRDDVELFYSDHSIDCLIQGNLDGGLSKPWERHLETIAA